MATAPPRIFFTYVWGAPGEPAWPLTFANKGARTHARGLLSEGDIVFTVCTQGEPTPTDLRGRVVGKYLVSNLEVNTADYGLRSKHADPQFDSVGRFPFALHPIAVWTIDSSENFFGRIVGPLTRNHHLHAQSRLVELTLEEAAGLLLLRSREVVAATPQTAFGAGRVALKNSKLAPKHQGSFVGQFRDHDVWYVYTLVLRGKDGRAAAVKVGYAHDPKEREASYNGKMASEVTGLIWCNEFVQPTASEDAARATEQAVLRHFADRKLASNGEILRDVDPMSVETRIAISLRGIVNGE